MKRRAFRRPKRPACAGRPMRRRDLSSAVGRKAAGPKSAEGRQGISLRASRAPAPVARRQAVARAAANATCAAARRSPLLRLRKSRAAASGRGPEAKVRGREVRTWAVSVEQVSGLVQPRQPNPSSVPPSALLPAPARRVPARSGRAATAIANNWRGPWSCAAARRSSGATTRRALAHVPEKWTPVFRKEHAPLQKKESATRSIRTGCALIGSTPRARLTRSPRSREANLTISLN